MMGVLRINVKVQSLPLHRMARTGRLLEKERSDGVLDTRRWLRGAK